MGARNEGLYFGEDEGIEFFLHSLSPVFMFVGFCEVGGFNGERGRLSKEGRAFIHSSLSQSHKVSSIIRLLGS